MDGSRLRLKAHTWAGQGLGIGISKMARQRRSSGLFWALVAAQQCSLNRYAMQITDPADGQELWTGPVFFNIGGAGALATPTKAIRAILKVV